MIWLNHPAVHQAEEGLELLVCLCSLSDQDWLQKERLYFLWLRKHLRQNSPKRGLSQLWQIKTTISTNWEHD